MEAWMPVWGVISYHEEISALRLEAWDVKRALHYCHISRWCIKEFAWICVCYEEGSDGAVTQHMHNVRKWSSSLSHSGANCNLFICTLQPKIPRLIRKVVMKQDVGKSRKSILINGILSSHTVFKHSVPILRLVSRTRIKVVLQSFKEGHNLESA